MKPSLIAAVLLSLTNVALGQEAVSPPPLLPAANVDASLAPGRPAGDADAGAILAPGSHWETKGKTGLSVAGWAMWATGYFAASGYAIEILNESRRFGPTDASTYLLFVPVVGPLISQAMFSTCSRCGGSFFGNADPFRVLVTVVTSALQIPGFLMIFRGAVERTRVAVPDPISVSIAPGAPGGAVGLSLVLRN
ncbi:MAG: hypothetical protein H6Q89_4841 [Myxococcaceae bacterium]|nr:hypothetical protein [Myxococcaceae bacterium]